MLPQRWQLELGDKVVACIKVDDYEYPWIYGTLIDDAGFERFRTYFVGDELWPETTEFDALIDEIQQAGGFVLRNCPESVAYRSFRLNHEGSTVWFRHGDE